MSAAVPVPYSYAFTSAPAAISRSSIGRSRFPAAGLTLAASGQITGTPTTAGNFAFTAGVTDSSSLPQTAGKAFTIGVAATPPPTVGRLAATVATSAVAA